MRRSNWHRCVESPSSSLRVMDLLHGEPLIGIGFVVDLSLLAVDDYRVLPSRYRSDCPRAVPSCPQNAGDFKGVVLEKELFRLE